MFNNVLMLSSCTKVGKKCALYVPLYSIHLATLCLSVTDGSNFYNIYWKNQGMDWIPIAGIKCVKNSVYNLQNKMYEFLIFYVFTTKICKNVPIIFVNSMCPSIYPHVAHQEWLNRFSWNLILGSFSLSLQSTWFCPVFG
jgi:hypothetical protein